MDQKEFDAMEVKPVEAGWYFVEMHQFKKLKPEHPDYIKDWMEFNGTSWVYDGYCGCCYVCFIHKRETTEHFSPPPTPEEG